MIAKAHKGLTTLALLALVAACIVGGFGAVFNLLGRILP
jgi:hypothetical protein